MMFMLRAINRTVIHVARTVSEPVGSLSDRAASDEKTAMVAVVLIFSAATLLMGSAHRKRRERRKRRKRARTASW